jgi:HSP20 family protein
VSFVIPCTERRQQKVTLTSNRLTVSGKREHEEKKEDEHHYTLERSFGSFTLPDDINGEKVHAELKQGVLTLMLPRRPESQAKQVEIKVK